MINKFFLADGIIHKGQVVVTFALDALKKHVICLEDTRFDQYSGILHCVPYKGDRHLKGDEPIFWLEQSMINTRLDFGEINDREDLLVLDTLAEREFLQSPEGSSLLA